MSRDIGLERYLMRMGGLGDSEAGAQVALPEDGTVSGAIAGPQTADEFGASLQAMQPDTSKTILTLGAIGLVLYMLSR